MEKETEYTVQDAFLSQIRRSRASVTVFLVNGVKLQGNITWFDDTTVLLKRDDQTQLIYKHAISTVMPSIPVNIFETPANTGSEDRETTLGDDFI
ncbi:RNA chaperone Hfq [Acetobacter orientalis]|uniref:RNA chaperone Hfq n=1 Tax=Acetobacter orientalis TaxID=146474 RepID=UPI0039EA10EC